MVLHAAVTAHGSGLGFSHKLIIHLVKAICHNEAALNETKALSEAFVSRVSGVIRFCLDIYGKADC